MPIENPRGRRPQTSLAHRRGVHRRRAQPLSVRRQLDTQAVAGRNRRRTRGWRVLIAFAQLSKQPRFAVINHLTPPHNASFTL